MILVTGGTGFVGSHLLYHLTLNNKEIIAIYRNEDSIEKTKKFFSLYSTNNNFLFNKIKWLKANLINIPSLKKIFSYKIEQVYHCAALVSFDPKDYREMRKVNIEGTSNLINLCIDNKIKKICFVSSIASLGDSINNKSITEENHWNDSTLKSGYSITKFKSEMEIWRGSQEGLDVVIVNPGIIIGNGFNKEACKVFKQVKKGLIFYTTGVNGFVGVKDVVKIMISLMSSKIKNERFILVSENISYKDILFKIADCFKVKRPYIKVNKIVLFFLLRIDWFLKKILKRKPLLTNNSVRVLATKQIYSSKKIKKKLNIKFEKINAVIEKTCNNYLN